MISVYPVRSSHELQRFIWLPWMIYRGDPNWVPPLISHQRRVVAHFYPPPAQGWRCLFLAEKKGRAVGCLAVLIDPALNLAKGSDVGYFSLFESINDEEVAGRLFEAAAGWLRQRGLGMLKGPVSPGGPQEDTGKGLLVEGFDRPPVFMTSYNPPYYQRLLEGSGFSKDFDFYAYLLEKEQILARIPPAKLFKYVTQRYHLHLKTFDLENPEPDIRAIQRVLDLAVPAEWPDVLPPSLDEVRATAERLREIADTDFVVIARVGDEPVGFAAALPDYNQVFLHMNGRFTPLALLKYFYYKRKITCLRLFIMFVVPAFRKKGVPHAIYNHIFEHAYAKGYTHGEGSIIGEHNVEMQRDIEKFGGKRYKTYRIYQKAIGT
jgi:GNAT superfamily N-acetyltransferase